MKTRILVVDDSAVMRQAMVAIGNSVRDLEVRVAADPLIALKKIEEEKPDVILLDIEMPRMDGLTFLRKIMVENPIPVVVCSALAGRGTEIALRALEEGALDIVPKPRLALHEFLGESTLRLVETIRAAAQARVLPRVARVIGERRNTSHGFLPLRRASAVRSTRKLVAIGASTGGTEALREILEAMPHESPPIVVVQHMPEVFTAAFAQRLDRSCHIEVKEAADGDRIIDGRALIAPGNRHLIVHRDGGEYRVEVRYGPLASRHRPSVDVMFRSVASAARANAVGIILTGMGDDGAEGLLEMRRAGALTVAQDEASCVVFGMPKEAIARGAAMAVLPLGEIPDAILRATTKVDAELLYRT